MEGKYFFSLTFSDSNETIIFMFKFSMEAYPQMKFELVFQQKELHIFSYHVPKRTKSLKKNWLLIFNFKKRLEQPTSISWAFWDKQVCESLTPPKNVQVFLQILNPVNDAEILTPELVGGQSEMVV